MNGTAGIHDFNASLGNQIYRNNPINGVVGGANQIFSLAPPIGGNFWAANNTCASSTNGICDQAFGLDSHPWATPSGWES